MAKSNVLYHKRSFRIERSMILHVWKTQENIRPEILEINVYALRWYMDRRLAHLTYPSAGRT